jgi:rhodanese-related sulfurtransferase
MRALAENRRVIILDARATSDWSRGHITGALPFPFYNIDEMAGRIPNDGTWIVAYCACPHAASGHVVDELRRRGFRHTAVLDEGITYWTNHHYPTAQAALLHP